MSIGFKQGSVFTEIGPSGILHSLCSTIAVHLEGGDWGAKFPLLMTKLYQESLPAEDANGAVVELSMIRQGLSKVSADKVVWDFDDRTNLPPWSNVAPPHVGSAAEYFVAANGRNLLGELADNLESLQEFGGSLDVLPTARAFGG